MKKSIKTLLLIVISVLVSIQLSIVSYSIEFDSIHETNSYKVFYLFEYTQKRLENVALQIIEQNENSRIELFKILALSIFFIIILFIYIKNSILIKKLKQQNNNLHDQIEKLTLSNKDLKAFNDESILLNEDLVHMLQFKDESLAMSNEKYQSLLKKYESLKIKHDRLLLNFNVEQNNKKLNKNFLSNEKQNIVHSLNTPYFQNILNLNLTDLNNYKKLFTYKFKTKLKINIYNYKKFFWKWQKDFQTILLNKATQYLNKLYSRTKLKRYLKKNNYVI